MTRRTSPRATPGSVSRWVRRTFTGVGLAVVLAVVPAFGLGPTVAWASPFDVELQLAAHAAVKIGVTGEGWVHVPAGQLHAAGLPADADPSALQLYADGVEQPLEVTGNGDATLDDDEAIEFYGTGRDTLWTGVRTYWLVVGAAGARVPYAVYPVGATPPASFSFTTTLRQRTTYYAPLLNGDVSNFFGSVVESTGTMSTLSVPNIANPATAVLDVTLQGATAGGHVVAVSFGGAPLGTCALTGHALVTCPFALPSVTAGASTVGLVATGAAPDISLVQSLAITYDHAPVADGDRLELTVPPQTTVTVGGFSSSDVRVVDVTDPDAPLELVVGLSGAGAAWSATVNVPAGDGPHTLLAFTNAVAMAPTSVVANQPSSWATTGGGELLIIAASPFVEAVRPLAARRAAEGWSVALVDLQDVYDELGAGDKSAFAIRDFVSYALTHWQRPPGYVLLVGDATFDPRNFLGQGDFDFVPTKLIDTTTMETASDDWFVDEDGDGLPDLAIGRLPVRTAAETTTVVQKILGYGGKAELPRGALFVTDVGDAAFDFADASAGSEPAVADIMPIDHFSRADPNATAAGLLAKLDAGPFLVNYFGHGSVEVWTDLFSSTDAAALTNEHLSIYVSMNCLNGFFHDLYTTSLAEALLEAPNGGAVAAWASSTLTSFDPQATLNREFLARLTRMSLGQADLAAKRTITDVDAQRTWMIFGDPTLFGTPSAASPDGGVGDGAASDGAAMADGARAGDAGDGSAGDGQVEGPVLADAEADVSDGAADAAQPSAAGGCSCRWADGRPRPLGLGLVVLALVGATWRRRRRSR